MMVLIQFEPDDDGFDSVWTRSWWFWFSLNQIMMVLIQSEPDHDGFDSVWTRSWWFWFSLNQIMMVLIQSEPDHYDFDSVWTRSWWFWFSLNQIMMVLIQSEPDHDGFDSVTWSHPLWCSTANTRTSADPRLDSPDEESETHTHVSICTLCVCVLYSCVCVCVLTPLGENTPTVPPSSLMDTPISARIDSLHMETHGSHDHVTVCVQYHCSHSPDTVRPVRFTFPVV